MEGSERWAGGGARRDDGGAHCGWIVFLFLIDLQDRGKRAGERLYGCLSILLLMCRDWLHDS